MVNTVNVVNVVNIVVPVACVSPSARALALRGSVANNAPGKYRLELVRSIDGRGRPSYGDVLEWHGRS